MSSSYRSLNVLTFQKYFQYWFTLKISFKSIQASTIFPNCVLCHVTICNQNCYKIRPGWPLILLLECANSWCKVVVATARSPQWGPLGGRVQCHYEGGNKTLIDIHWRTWRFILSRCLTMTLCSAPRYPRPSWRRPQNTALSGGTGDRTMHLWL